MDTSKIEWGKVLGVKWGVIKTQKAHIGSDEYIIKRVSRSEANTTVLEIFEKQIAIARLLSQEDKDSIALITESDETDSEILYSRPYIEGEVLSERIKKGPFIKQQEAAEIILKIARIVSNAHKYQLIHGDLKPENIICRKEDGGYSIIDWDTMLTDKDILNAKSSTGVTLSANETAGTAEYMSPQLCQDKPLTYQDDVYALGIIFHEMLTGKTPFDDCKGKRGQIAVEKSKGDPRSISVKFPERHIDSCFDEIYQRATKNKQLDRFQTVDEFIEILEFNIKKKACSETTIVPAQVKPQNVLQTPNEDRSADDIASLNLVLVGPDGAGKTVLAAALCGISDNQDPFFFNPKDEETRTFVRNAQLSLEKGSWPPGTKDRTAKHLSFEIVHKGKKATVQFDDYNGEDLKNTPELFCKRFFKHTDGVLFLLNPGIVNDKDYIRKDKIDAVTKAITVLTSQKTNPPPMALVITASDRLETDLKVKKEEFLSYTDQILKCAETLLPSGTFPKFEISVTGKLRCQGDPGKNIPFSMPEGKKLNWSDAQRPFVWILSQLDEREKRTARKSWLKWAAVFLSLVFLSFLFVKCYDDKDYQELDARLNKIDPEKVEFNKEHLDEIKEIKSKIDAWSPFISSQNKTRLSKHYKEIYERILLGSILYKLNNIISEPGKNANLLEEVDRFLPNVPQKLKDDRYHQKLKEAKLLIFTAAFESLKNDLQNVIDKSETRVPKDYQLRYEKLKLMVNKKYSSDGVTKLKEIDKKYEQAIAVLFSHNVTSLKGKIAKCSVDDVKNLFPLIEIIQDYDRVFIENQYDKISSDLFKEKKVEAKFSLKMKISELITKMCDEFGKKQPDEPKFNKNPSFKIKIEKDIFSVIKDNDLRKELQKNMERGLESAEQKWKEARKAAVTKFLEDNKGKDISEILRKLNKFLQENNYLESSNPYLGDIEEFTIKKLYKHAEDFIRKVEGKKSQEKDFSQMKDIYRSLSKINREKYPNIRKDNIFGWYKKYYDWKQNNPSFQVSFGELAVKVHYEKPKKAYFKKFSLSQNKRTLTDFIYSTGWGNIYFDDNGKYTPFKGKGTFFGRWFNCETYWPPKPKSGTYYQWHVGEKLNFVAEIWDCNEWGGWKKDRFIDKIDFSYFPGVDEIPKTIEQRAENGKATVKMEITVRPEKNGQTFASWRKANPLPERKGK